MDSLWIVAAVAVQLVVMVTANSNLSPNTDLTGIAGSSGRLEEYCDTQTFSPQCNPQHEVVVIQSAKYGRMRLGKCVEIDLGYIGCFSSVLWEADRLCGGRRACQIPVPNAAMEDTRPCLKELKTFMEVAYSCVHVASPAGECGADAGGDPGGVNLTAPNGYLASIVTIETGCGGMGRPWVVQALPGQRINLTLYDFSVERWGGTAGGGPAYGGPGGGPHVEVCHEYGIIDDDHNDNPQVICGGVTRISHIYMSRGPTVKVRITVGEMARSRDKYFMIHYNVIGCPDPVVPDNTWFKRRPAGGTSDAEEVLEMGCKHGAPDASWRLVCGASGAWVSAPGGGPSVNCSLPHASVRDEHQGGAGGLDAAAAAGISYGIAVAIILGAALGVGLVIVVVGIIRYRRRRQHLPCGGRGTLLLRHPRGGGGGGGCAGDMEMKCTCPNNSGGSSTLPSASAAGLYFLGGPRCGAPVPPEEQALIKASSLPAHSPATRDALLRHQRTLRIHGNEYEHIWEAPLPTPASSHSHDSGYTTYKPDKPPRALPAASHIPITTTGTPGSTGEKATCVTAAAGGGGDTVTVTTADTCQGGETARYSALNKTINRRSSQPTLL